jgi:RNA polymerase sigma factor (sigma-70 family)
VHRRSAGDPLSAEPARKQPPSRARWSNEATPKTTELSNHELVQLLRDDPARGTPLVYERFAPEVNRLAWRLLGADPDHNDVVQQVFFQVMTKGGAVRDPERLGAWIRAITVRTVYSLQRRRGLKRFFFRAVDEDDAHADLVRDVEARDLLFHARHVLSKLPARERIVFSLHFIEGHTLEEVAELCGFSVATAKRRLRRANQRFLAMTERLPELARLIHGDEK